jgi:hypothetical protein
MPYNERERMVMPTLKKAFDISVKVDTPVVVGQDDVHGRRQLIPITSGELTGEGLHGTVLPGGVDSQVIRPDGICELSARYGVRMDDGSSFYIENNGIRTVPAEYTAEVLQGKFIDPSLYYFCTKPSFEIYDDRLDWLNRKLFICCAVRLPDQVILGYYTVETD